MNVNSFRMNWWVWKLTLSKDIAYRIIPSVGYQCWSSAKAIRNESVDWVALRAAPPDRSITRSFYIWVMYFWIFVCSRLRIVWLFLNYWNYYPSVSLRQCIVDVRDKLCKFRIRSMKKWQKKCIRFITFKQKIIKNQNYLICVSKVSFAIANPSQYA